MDGTHDMDHVRSAAQFRADGAVKDAVYGDTVGGRSFTDEESKLLQLAARIRRPVISDGEWRTTWSRLTAWTIINCQPETKDEIEEYRSALASATADA